VVSAISPEVDLRLLNAPAAAVPVEQSAGAFAVSTLWRKMGPSATMLELSLTVERMTLTEPAPSAVLSAPLKVAPSAKKESVFGLRAGLPALRTCNTVSGHTRTSGDVLSVALWKRVMDALAAASGGTCTVTRHLRRQLSKVLRKPQPAGLEMVPLETRSSPSPPLRQDAL